MRRKDRERNEQFALEVVRKAEYGTLATVNADNTPYCVPISAVLLNNYIYFHCAGEGKKLDNIVHNNKVCLTFVGNTKRIPEKFTTEYASAVVRASCFVVVNDEEKLAALKAITQKYAASSMGCFDDEAKNFCTLPPCAVPRLMRLREKRTDKKILHVSLGKACMKNLFCLTEALWVWVVCDKPLLS